MARVRGWRWVWGLVVFCAVMATASRAQVTFTTLVEFNQTNGSTPYMVLTQGADGNLYGTTNEGGLSDVCASLGAGGGCGTVFKMTPEGVLTTLYSFCSEANCSDGRSPIGFLAEGASGDFYGTTAGGGAHSGGTVFKITPAGVLTTLYSFCSLPNCADGNEPAAGLVRGTNGNFYGTTSGGDVTAGTVFEITPSGKLTTLSSTGSFLSELMQATNGDFYGEDGSEYGTIFEVTPSGKLTTMFDFDYSDGAYPDGGLIQSANGNYYGVTSGGGSGSSDECIRFVGCGTVFKITPAGKLTTLYNFCSLANCTDGAQPYGPLIQGTDGNLYGTTEGYEANGGTVFEISSADKLSTLYSFCSLPACADGYFPLAGMLQATNGTFYGTTSGGGSGKDGTIFSLSTGLCPFVKTEPTYAKQGVPIGIFGQGFTTSSVVQFGGVQATNVKLSGTTFLTAKVPAGALTGSVTVTTGTTTLTSNQPFRVKPQVVSFDPPSGSVGTQVTITGTGFTQTNGVGFGDNVPAEFTVNSDTQVTATVPTGAKTGPIGVVTKGGTAVSKATFTVN
jgi:uncharacterized repeat protein (TIGR03803 family)